MTEFECVECGDAVSEEWLSEKGLSVPLCESCYQKTCKREEPQGAGGYS